MIRRFLISLLGILFLFSGTSAANVQGRKLPDLTVTGITITPSDPTTANLIEFKAVIKNIGSQVAVPSKAGIRVGREINPKIYNIPELKPGASYVIGRSAKLRRVMNYRVTVTTDIAAQVLERNEKNNIGFKSFRVTFPKLNRAQGLSFKGNWSLKKGSAESVYIEQYAPGRRGKVRSLRFALPHRPSRIETIQYEVIDGLAIFEGDMILGPAEEVAKTFSPPPTSEKVTESSGLASKQQALIVRAGRQYLWANGLIPYQLDSSFDLNMEKRIKAAIIMINQSTNLRLQPHRGESDYVRFRKVNSGCSADVGRKGGRQYINLSTRCGTGNIAHEILHAAGMWHEQSRNDRDAFVRILWNNIEAEKEHNFRKHDADGIDIGKYDYISIMHYSRTAFGKTDPATGAKLPTIESTDPTAVIGQRNRLSPRDIAGVNSLYPLTVGYISGENWRTDSHATSIAFGDVDGDGLDEVGIARKTHKDDRFIVLDDARHNYRLLYSFGETWRSNSYATCIAFGDVDGDGRDEMGVTRRTNKGDRLVVFDDARNRFRQLYCRGEGWRSDSYATCIAFGDVDGDGRDEIGVTRYTGKNDRYVVFDDARQDFRILFSGGDGWGSGIYATCIAFGDVDGDGRDEVGITRNSDRNARYWILTLKGGKLVSLRGGGSGWGSSTYATSIAFGDVDGDGRDEVGITRNTDRNARYYILDDYKHQFRLIREGGQGWGSSNYATSIAFGDVDRDGRDEVGIARRAVGNDRYWILDDAREFFQTIEGGGRGWGSSYYATCIAFGDVDGDKDADFGITRYARNNMRFAIFEMNR